MSDVSSSQDKAIGKAVVPWSPFAAVLVGALAFAGVQIVAAIFIAFMAGLAGLRGESWLGSTAGQFVFVLLSDALILAVIWQFVRSHRVSFRVLGFMRKPNWQDAGYALAGFAVYFGVLIVVMAIVGALTSINLDQKQELGFDNLLDTPEKIMALTSLVLLPPIVEEIVFRGFLFTSLRKRLTFIWATLVTSLLFAGPHLLASSEGLLWVAGVDTLVLSLVLCYMREKTGALWAPIVIHAIKNSIAFIVLMSAAKAV